MLLPRPADVEQLEWRSHLADKENERRQAARVPGDSYGLTSGTCGQPEEIARPMPGFSCGQFKYLVKAYGDSFFFIDKYMDAEQQISYNEFIDDYIFEEVNPDVPVHLKAFKPNEEEGKWEWVETLGDRVFFVGDDCSYSISARGFAGLKRDLHLFFR
ncbi:hypothetical protein F0562_025280 [Nyssa sinensis]|uniref:KIB1-4 beta-propeller domain-containing protein n=1 Tax=Nyssa sinensis TaxID=561372 RepID=A0A5J5BHP3_9ASTE|nr:hypothetical protein F0562_025280 [Nyssa sinensis]